MEKQRRWISSTESGEKHCCPIGFIEDVSDSDVRNRVIQKRSW